MYQNVIQFFFACHIRVHARVVTPRANGRQYRQGTIAVTSSMDMLFRLRSCHNDDSTLHFHRNSVSGLAMSISCFADDIIYVWRCARIRDTSISEVMNDTFPWWQHNMTHHIWLELSMKLYSRWKQVTAQLKPVIRFYWASPTQNNCKEE